MKVAIIHDWLISERGGEKVFNHIARLFPEADVFTLFYREKGISSVLRGRRIYTSILQKIPRIEKFYRYLLPLFPYLIERFNLSGYDLVISSSHCVAKGVRLNNKTLHLCFCHTPMRYAWMFHEEYLRGKFYAPLALFFLERIRRWDYQSSKSVHYFAANSKEVQSRIKKFYGRESDIVYPPLDLRGDIPAQNTGDYFLVVSALVRYKKIDLAVEAFNDLGFPLKIVGSGECESELKKMAKRNIDFIGWVDDQSLRKLYGGAKALIFPGLEDFGITPLEAQAAGTPVIALGKGGVSETVLPEETGLFFHEQTKEALKDAVLRFEKLKLNRSQIRSHALSFVEKNSFDSHFRSWIDEKLELFKSQTRKEGFVTHHV